jgi:CRISPR system Cascade subunit CasE
MSDHTLHLVKVPLRADKLVAMARRRQINVRNMDDGYFAHCLLTELWQENAPAPFVLRGNGRTLDAWGYSPTNAARLMEHARAFGDPSILEALDGDAIASRAMPRFDRGRRVGFLTRVCPVTRLIRPTNGHRAGAEIDVFLAKCFSLGSDVAVSREATYREWFANRLADSTVSGAMPARVTVAGIARAHVVRRTQGNERKARTLQRPDVHLEGDLIIEDGDTFLRFLARGVGRHRAFGFGALMVVPPGTSHTPP